MNENFPDTLFDAKVIAFAKVSPEYQRTGKTTHSVGGIVKGSATHMVIAQYPEENSFYVFGLYQDGSETDTWHESLDNAIKQLDWEYENLSQNLVWKSKPASGH